MEAETIHMVPLNDLRPHDCNPKCWCKPTPDEEYLELFLHHSMDGREKFEIGDRKYS